MDSQPLVTHRTDAGARLIAEFGKAHPVAAAFWMRGPGEDQPHLYLASPGVTDAHLAEAGSGA